MLIANDFMFWKFWSTLDQNVEMSAVSGNWSSVQNVKETKSFAVCFAVELFSEYLLC